MFLYVFTIWFIANLIHPVALWLTAGDGFYMEADTIPLMFVVFMYCFFFSLPSLLFSYLVLWLISKSNVKDEWKYIWWLLSVPLIIFFNLFLIYLLFGLGRLSNLNDFEVGYPAIGATIVVVLIRYKYFFRTINIGDTENKPSEEKV